MSSSNGDKPATFTELMRPARERNEKTMIVFGDTIRHIKKWEDKGMPRRLVAEGLVMAALAQIYEDDNPREWLSFFQHMIAEAEKEQNKVRNEIMDWQPPSE